jgi:hypothetical protein
MASRSNARSGIHSQDALKQEFKRSLRWTIMSGLALSLSVGFAIFISNGMPGHALWSATRVPTVVIASIATVALAVFGSKALWALKELK